MSDVSDVYDDVFDSEIMDRYQHKSSNLSDNSKTRFQINSKLFFTYNLYTVSYPYHEIDNLGNVSVQDDQSEFDEHRFDRYRGNRYDAKMNFRDKYSLSDKKYKKEEYKRDWSSMFKRK